MFVIIHLLTWNVATDHRINLWDSKVLLLRLLTKDDNWLTRGDNCLKKTRMLLLLLLLTFVLVAFFHRLLQVRSGSAYVSQTFGDFWCETCIQAGCPSLSPNRVKALKEYFKINRNILLHLSCPNHLILPLWSQRWLLLGALAFSPPFFHCKLINHLVMLILATSCFTSCSTFIVQQIIVQKKP